MAAYYSSLPLFCHTVVFSFYTSIPYEEIEKFTKHSLSYFSACATFYFFAITIRLKDLENIKKVT
jgi:hypothetical protein